MSTPDIEITIPNFRDIPLVITVQSLDSCGHIESSQNKLVSNSWLDGLPDKSS